MHNRSIKKNCDILKRLIPCIEMLACQKLPFWGQDETEESKSKGHFLGMCEALVEYCFWSHLDFVKKNASYTFSRFSSNIQNETINYITAIIEDEIKTMIKNHHLFVFCLMRLQIFEWKNSCHVSCDLSMRKKSFERF